MLAPDWTAFGGEEREGERKKIWNKRRWSSSDEHRRNDSQPYVELSTKPRCLVRIWPRSTDLSVVIRHFTRVPFSPLLTRTDTNTAHTRSNIHFWCIA